MTATLLAAALAAAGALALWFAARRRVEVPCTLELEATQERFHAHVHLEGVSPNEGDEVLVHGAPSRIAAGERRTMRAHATVHQASLPRRAWTRLIGTSEITGLYEVGFEG
ncbi:hypothetical protein [Roseisolibacter sp. H3M3-2]|uniref:hypothetical protein n=1 Tax=Roseisolibacter sp. H3M3-2 TaxID=3031323 RepID=UPI0023DA321B|nr:hypothetical protein [Roseisolibacter sp. H3M3-2]MDF1501856.1 hypothetical protein [Roseisolibacter sp. H3M3-2]